MRVKPYLVIAILMALTGCKTTKKATSLESLQAMVGQMTKDVKNSSDDLSADLIRFSEIRIKEKTGYNQLVDSLYVFENFTLYRVKIQLRDFNFNQVQAGETEEFFPYPSDDTWYNLPGDTLPTFQEASIGEIRGIEVGWLLSYKYLDEYSVSDSAWELLAGKGRGGLRYFYEKLPHLIGQPSELIGTSYKGGEGRHLYLREFLPMEKLKVVDELFGEMKRSYLQLVAKENK